MDHLIPIHTVPFIREEPHKLLELDPKTFQKLRVDFAHHGRAMPLYQLFSPPQG